MQCKLGGCTNEVVQPVPMRGRPRLFCCPEHRVQHWNDQQARVGPSTRHSISNVDEQARTGTCSICGPVTVWRINDKYEDGTPRLRWKCAKQGSIAREGSRKRYSGSEKRRLTAMRHRYNLTQEQLDEALALNTGKCHICGRPADETRMVLDHCHDGGHVRGWLCDNCNTGIGMFKDDPERLQAAIAYLERDRSSP